MNLFDVLPECTEEELGAVRAIASERRLDLDEAFFVWIVRRMRALDAKIKQLDARADDQAAASYGKDFFV